MGVCSSCLGRRSRDLDGEPYETSRLLNSQTPQARYDGSASDEFGYLDFEAGAEPERERQEREALTAIWKLTSDHLIDITQGTSVPGEQTTTTDAEFANLFHEVFRRRQRPKPGNAPNHVSGVESDDDDEDDLHADEQQVNEQEWLKDIILRDPTDDSWDCNKVRKIGRPLVINFDDS